MAQTIPYVLSGLSVRKDIKMGLLLLKKYYKKELLKQIYRHSITKMPHDIYGNETFFCYCPLQIETFKCT